MPTRTVTLSLASSLIIVVAIALGWGWSAADRTDALNEQVKTEMHLEVDGTSAGPVHCDSRTQSSCRLAKGATFSLKIIPNVIPPGGYGGFQTLIEYGSLLYAPTANLEDEIFWPPTLLPVRSLGPVTEDEDHVGHGALAGFTPPFPASFQKTTLIDLAFTCAQNGQTPGQGHSGLIELVSFAQTPSGSVYVEGDGETDHVPNVGSLTIECFIPPTATPTPSPTPTLSPTPTPTHTPVPTSTPVPSATPIPTSTPVPSATPTFTPTPTLPPNTTATPAPDSDGDGCSDVAESGLNPRLGGDRDHLYFWDFYDVWTHPSDQPGAWERDRLVVVLDILAVAARFGRGAELTKEEALAAALTPPTDDDGYHPAYDRGPRIGDDPWDSAPPDGVINIPADILAVASQFGHNCR